MSTDSPRIPHRASTGYKRDSVNRALLSLNSDVECELYGALYMERIDFVCITSNLFMYVWYVEPHSNIPYSDMNEWGCHTVFSCN